MIFQQRKLNLLILCRPGHWWRGTCCCKGRGEMLRVSYAHGPVWGAVVVDGWSGR
ncbi:hypothetical protein EMPG_17317 [Blastomyces silverae]|uniref:Uncharacterized protein n=1 Tax=Blastomyces silverae TaxID=2060906 RepID=A0A0H1B6V9_9EURO|nr:hypothetical protein EMPG_17317 [Blastomyces silverae]